MNESRHTQWHTTHYLWASVFKKRHMWHMILLCHTYDSVMSHIWTSHVPHSGTPIFRGRMFGKRWQAGPCQIVGAVWARWLWGVYSWVVWSKSDQNGFMRDFALYLYVSFAKESYKRNDNDIIRESYNLNQMKIVSCETYIIWYYIILYYIILYYIILYYITLYYIILYY